MISVGDGDNFTWEKTPMIGVLREHAGLQIKTQKRRTLI
jgi:hypothetical protein